MNRTIHGTARKYHLLCTYIQLAITSQGPGIRIRLQGKAICQDQPAGKEREIAAGSVRGRDFLCSLSRSLVIALQRPVSVSLSHFPPFPSAAKPSICDRPRPWFTELSGLGRSVRLSPPMWRTNLVDWGTSEPGWAMKARKTSSHISPHRINDKTTKPTCSVLPSKIRVD